MTITNDQIPSTPVSGYVKIKRSDGVETSFSNHIMLSHYTIILRAISGQNNGKIGVFGAGTSTAQDGAKNLTQMTSESDQNEISSYAAVLGANPTDSLEDLDADPDIPNHVQEYTSAVHFSGSFGATTHDELDDEEISEIALFAADSNDPEGRGKMFARTIIPEDERLEKFPGASLTFLWVIYYGFEEDTFLNMNGI